MSDNNINIANHFPIVEGFQIVVQKENRIIYEKYYENLKSFVPRKNVSTNEVERCIIIIEAHEIMNNLCKIAIGIKRSFPSGTDFGNNNIIDINSKPNLIPLDVEFFDKYFLNISTGDFFVKNRNIKIAKLLNKLYNNHIRPTKPILGIFIRVRIKLHTVVFNATHTLIKAIEHVMIFATGKYVMKENTAQEIYLELLDKNKIKMVDIKSLKLPMGWECSRNVAFVSSLLILVLFYLLWDSIKATPVVAAIVLPSWIIILYFLDTILPYILFYLMNGLIRIIRIK